jgi:hypothetical protein
VEFCLKIVTIARKKNEDKGIQKQSIISDETVMEAMRKEPRRPPTDPKPPPRKEKEASFAQTLEMKKKELSSKGKRTLEFILDMLKRAKEAARPTPEPILEWFLHPNPEAQKRKANHLRHQIGISRWDVEAMRGVSPETTPPPLQKRILFSAPAEVHNSFAKRMKRNMDSTLSESASPSPVPTIATLAH